MLLKKRRNQAGKLERTLKQVACRLNIRFRAFYAFIGHAKSIPKFPSPRTFLDVKDYRRRWRAITSSCQRLESETNRAENPHTRTMRS